MQKSTRKIVILSAIAATAVSSAAVMLNVRAQSPIPEAPAPVARPPEPTQAANSPIDLIVPKPPTEPDSVLTSAFGRIENPLSINGPLKSGLDALSIRDAATAISLRNSLLHGSLDRQILTWAIATAAVDGISSDEIMRAQAELSGWPGEKSLRRSLERALFKENATPAAAIKALANTQLQTAQGAIALARAFVSNGQPDKALQTLEPWWTKENLPADDEQAILTQFGKLLTTKDHQKRLLLSLYNDRMGSAKALAQLAGGQALYNAFVAVGQRSPKADKAIADVEAIWQKDPIYTYLKVRKLRRTQNFNDAANLMLRAPQDAASLVDPDAWWVERRIISRKLLELGKPQLAYQLASAHAAESPTMAAEAEFHAGWYALRGLKQPKTAIGHFAKIAEISSGPISASRAYYWRARALEASGGDAKEDYRRSAHFGTTFYGQLSAAKLGEKSPELSYPTPTDADRKKFAGRPAVQAIKRLEELGYRYRAAPLYIQLAQEIDSLSELALLASTAAQNENHYLALRVGKVAAGRGLDVGALSHPMGAIPDDANIAGAGKALAYAIARQESEFNTGAVSSAGARGLLQIMPATAQGVAGRNKLPYSEARLTSDPGYNATLGSHFLGEQLQRFNGSYVLTFASYNAGPRRADEWIRRYGDPRGKSVEDVVDWIEKIPFSETRNYVQRVLENYEVYKTRLTGTADIQSDLINGRK